MNRQDRLQKSLALVTVVAVLLSGLACGFSEQAAASMQDESLGGDRRGIIIDWLGPVGVTRGQTARLNILNAGEEHGIIIEWKILDAGGNTVAESDGRVMVAAGHTESFDLAFSDGHAMARTQLRAVVKAIGNPISTPEGACALHTTLEVFDNDTLKTVTFVKPSAVKGCPNKL